MRRGEYTQLADHLAVDDFTAYIHFEAEDGTKGEFEIPRAAIESLIS